MIRNVYFVATCCGDKETKYIDDKFIEATQKNLCCSCGKNEWKEQNEISENFKKEGKTGELMDHRKFNMKLYMSEDYQRKRSQIHDFHRDKSGFSKFKE